MIDLLEVDKAERVEELVGLGVDLVSLHVGKDKQQEGSFDTGLFALVKDHNIEVTVAGGINADTLPDIIEGKPDTVIVGSAITKAKSPREAAIQLKELLPQG
jgi:3-hexulose-6-phosphate synthase